MATNCVLVSHKIRHRNWRKQLWNITISVGERDSPAIIVVPLEGHFLMLNAASHRYNAVIGR
jgi:hypothetical protein